MTTPTITGFLFHMLVQFVPESTKFVFYLFFIIQNILWQGVSKVSYLLHEQLFCFEHDSFQLFMMPAVLLLDSKLWILSLSFLANLDSVVPQSHNTSLFLSQSEASWLTQLILEWPFHGNTGYLRKYHL